jgi:hypothetical protein
MEISSADQAIIAGFIVLVGMLCFVLGNLEGRAKPKRHVITVTQRLNDWHAAIDGDDMMAGAGPTPQSAVGCVVLGYRNQLHIEIKP